MDEVIKSEQYEIFNDGGSKTSVTAFVYNEDEKDLKVYPEIVFDECGYRLEEAEKLRANLDQAICYLKHRMDTITRERSMN